MNESEETEMTELTDAQRAAHEEIARRARAWGEEPVTPRPQWSAKVLAELERQSSDVAPEVGRVLPMAPMAPMAPMVAMDRTRAVPTRSWLPALRFAAAAVLLVGFGISGLVVKTNTRTAPSVTTGALLPAEALDDVRAAERTYAEAISRLEANALPILAAASDPSTAPRDAALLVGYRNRLLSVDRSIEGMRSYLETNPYHARTRAALLKSYGEKSELLREIVAMRRGA